LTRVDCLLTLISWPMLTSWPVWLSYQMLTHGSADSLSRIRVSLSHSSPSLGYAWRRDWRRDFFSGDAHSMVVHGGFAPAAFSGVAVTSSEDCRNGVKLLPWWLCALHGWFQRGCARCAVAASEGGNGANGFWCCRWCLQMQICNGGGAVLVFAEAAMVVANLVRQWKMVTPPLLQVRDEVARSLLLRGSVRCCCGQSCWICYRLVVVWSPARWLMVARRWMCAVGWWRRSAGMVVMLGTRWRLKMV